MQSPVQPSDLRHGPESGVDDAISHLAALTAQRDRELLDVTLVQGVLDLLGAASVAVYRLIGREDEARRWLCCGLSRKGSLTVSDPMWVDLHQLPLEEESPHRQRALALRELTHDENLVMGHGEHAALARHVVTFPLPVEVGLPGVLEVGSAEPLSLQAMRTVQTLLKVFGNFQNLLESSQRDALTSLLNRQTFDATFLKAVAASLAMLRALAELSPQLHDRLGQDFSIRIGISVSASFTVCVCVAAPTSEKRIIVALCVSLSFGIGISIGVIDVIFEQLCPTDRTCRGRIPPLQ